MFRRNGLPTRLLTAILAIAMAWATTPTQGLAEVLTTPQTQTTTSTSNDATSDASTSKPTPTGEKGQEATPSKSTTTGSDSSSSNDGEKAGAADEKDSKSNDNSGAAALAAPAAPSQDTSDNKDDQSTFTAHWTNAPDKEISYTNTDFDKDDLNTWTDFSCTPSENSLHKSTLKVYLKLAGDSKTTYKAGSVKIYVPAGFYRGLDKSDPLLVACSNAVFSKNPSLSQLSWMIPKAPETNSVTDFNYVEETREVNGQQVQYYVMQNAKDLAGSTELDVDIDYRFRPTMLDVVSAQVNGSDMGVYHGSYPVTCDVNGAAVDGGRNISVTVKTKVDSSTVTLTHATEDRNKGVFFAWDNAWGKKPADADKYFYVVWYATYQRGGCTTMPFNYRLSVKKDSTDGGELIGVKKYTGDSSNNAYEQHGVVLARMDNSYSGIYGHTDLLDRDWTGVLNDPTKSYAYNAAMCAGMGHDYGANSVWHFQVYALLFRYPLSKVSDAIKSGVDMTNQGIKISNGVTLTEAWQDGHVVTKDFGPTGDTSVKSLPAGGGSRELTKVRADENWRTREVRAVQSFISQGHEVTLPDFTLRSYNFDDKVSWNDKDKTYKAFTGFDIKDGDYYLYSAQPDYFGKAPGVQNISSNNPYKLSEDEYSLKDFYLEDDEYDVTYTDGLGWQRGTRTSEDFSAYSPVSIYIRKRGEKSLTKYGEVVRNVHGYVFTSEDGVNNLSGVSGNKRVKLPDGVVQIEMKQSDSKHYASYVRLHYRVTLHPDKGMEARLNSDIAASKPMHSVVGGFASGEQTVEGKSLGYSSNGVGNYWNYVSYELSPVSSGVVLQKETFGITDDAKKDERTIPVSVDYWTQTNVYVDSELRQFANPEYMKPYMITSGVFYDLLPAGTYVKRDEIGIGVRTGPISQGGVNSGIEPLSDKEVELIPNWYESGRTMLKVVFHVPDGKGEYNNYWSGLRLNYTLHDTYTNIVDRGGLVMNGAMLVNTSGDDVVFNSNARDKSYTGSGFDDWDYYKGIANDAWEKGQEAATTQTRMDFGNVTALQAGFNDLVSSDENASYQSSASAYLGDEYTDRIQYTADSTTRTDSVVLYDTFSNNDSSRIGAFEGVDVSSIESKPTYDANNPKTSDTCKPVVYYATEIPTERTRSLDSGIWRTTPPKDISTVRAVAIDCRKTDSGKNFVLDKKGTLVAYVHLKATTEKKYAGRIEKNEAAISKRMFVGTEPASSDSTTVQTANRTVKLLAADLSIKKTCDPESGTPSKPAEIGNAANKKLTYTITVTNKAEDKTLPDVTRIHVKDALPEGLSLESPSDMKVDSDSLSIRNTKIGGQSVVSYQTSDDGVSFDIARLPSGGSISITVPVVRKNPVKETTEYVNTATIETVGNARDGQNSSTYHKTSVTIMPLAGAGGFAGLVVAGCVVFGASAVAWVRRRRRE